MNFTQTLLHSLMELTLAPLIESSTYSLPIFLNESLKFGNLGELKNIEVKTLSFTQTASSPSCLDTV